MMTLRFFIVRYGGTSGSADFSGGREREYQEYSVIFAK